MSGRKVFGGFHHFFSGAGEEQKPESGEKRGLDPLMKVSAKEKVFRNVGCQKAEKWNETKMRFQGRRLFMNERPLGEASIASKQLVES